MLLKFWTISAALMLMTASAMVTPASTDMGTNLLTRGIEKRSIGRSVHAKRDNDEQHGDKYGEDDDGDDGDDGDNDNPQESAAKRSTLLIMKEKFAIPGSTDFSTVSGKVRRGGLKKRDHGKNSKTHKNESGSHRNEHGNEEEGEGEHGDRPDDGREAKREFKARRRLLAKRTIDSFVQKVQFGVDGIIYKQDMINKKIIGDTGSSTSSNSQLPNGHSEKAASAVSKAKSVSSAALSGDIKGMHDSQ